MTWAEYLIRIDGYLRIERKQQQENRRLWFNIIRAPHLDPKTLPKTEKQFYHVEGDAPIRASDKGKQLWQRRMEEYNKSKTRHEQQ